MAPLPQNRMIKALPPKRVRHLAFPAADSL
jgi:hypothetical protein